ncbi:MAG: 2-octaprenyl-6-methoxyphenyl hydroxylase [Porticoccaceae bacterium]|nr:2-octaprenyl-6-methoxyphenyl hydroxylase [Porticoccaceae bacterium]
MSQLDPDNQFDITIVGGGMVGISLALLLAKQQRWKVMVLESQAIKGASIPDYSPSFDARSTALSWSSRCIFQKIGVWPKIEQHAQAISSIHVSDRGHFGLTRLEAEEAGVDALGYVVENSWLGSVLMQQAVEEDISLKGAAKITSIHPKAQSMELAIEVDGQQRLINSKLLVVADGTDSACAKTLGIQQHSKAYGHSAIIANISLEQPHGEVAYERFTDQGPMALLPLPEFKNTHRCALVWTQPSEQAEALMVSDESAFLSQLQARFGHRLGQFKQLGERAIYPLALSTSEEQVRRRLVVVGNAAHSLHPVAGQGFNLSLRDIDCLVQCLKDQPQITDVGELEPLLSYQKQRDKDQRNTLMFTDNLSKLFGLSSSMVALGRNSGLLMMDLVPTLRNQFAHFGMGTGQSGVDHG